MTFTADVYSKALFSQIFRSHQAGRTRPRRARGKDVAVPGLLTALQTG